MTPTSPAGDGARPAAADPSGAARPEVTRVGAYAICRDHDERVLLVRLSESTPRPGTWALPGGGIDFGEDPRDAVVRELEEETGLQGTIRQLLTVASTVYDVPGSDPADPPAGRHHAIRVVYDVEIVAGSLTREVNGSTDDVGWFTRAELPGLAMAPYTRELLAEHAGPPEPATRP